MALLATTRMLAVAWQEKHGGRTGRRHPVARHEELLFEVGRRAALVVLRNRVQNIRRLLGLVQRKEHVMLLSNVASFNVLDAQPTEEFSVFGSGQADEDESETDALAHRVV